MAASNCNAPPRPVQAHNTCGYRRSGHAFFSPDGQWIGFFAGQKLKKIPLQGGGVVSLCDTAGLARGASWGEDGAIIANLDGYHLFRVPATGGEPQVIGKPEQHGERTWRWPQVLPGGENVLFTGAVAASAAAADSANIEVLSLKSGRVKVVRRGGYFGRYLPSGHLVYFRQGALYGVPFDLGRLETHGAPAPLLEDLADSESATFGRVSFSRTGILLYASAARRAGVAPIAWLDSAGKSQRGCKPIHQLLAAGRDSSPFAGRQPAGAGRRGRSYRSRPPARHGNQADLRCRSEPAAGRGRRTRSILFTSRMFPRATMNSASGGYAPMGPASLRSCSEEDSSSSVVDFP